MILTKDALSKLSRKGRTSAISLLSQVCRTGNLPDPYYEYRPGGYHKKRTHYHILKFRIPKFLEAVANSKQHVHDDDLLLFSSTLIGSGRDTNKQFSKTLAALEVIHQLEYLLNIKRGKLPQKLEELQAIEQAKKEQLETTPLEEQIANVSWMNAPMDTQFPDSTAPRRGRIDFFPSIRDHPQAFAAAKAVTLTARHRLPEVNVIGDMTEDGDVRKWANIRCSGRIKGYSDSHGSSEQMGQTEREAELYSLTQLGHLLEDNHQQMHLSDVWQLVAPRYKVPPSSMGMAKLFVEWPAHQFDQVKEVVQRIQDSIKNNNSTAESTRSKPQRSLPDPIDNIDNNKQLLDSRIASFRKHQQRTPLPIDHVETNIPYHAPVTILRGGTGSGKTTRYPLMLSLFSPGPCRVVVAQPRRLACQTAAQRVSSEQDTLPGQGPIGYAIRFESYLSHQQERTVDFMTPGVLLRQATQDPHLSSITHLCIDEVHERNADIDVLLALAKQAAQQRKQHPTLPPLHITLMSATLDSQKWQDYFSSEDVVIVDAPDARRFPIQIIPLGHAEFPLSQMTEWLNRKRIHSDYDEALCNATAELALHVYHTSPHLMKNGSSHDIMNEMQGSRNKKDGSILCFLPGMEEIKHVTSLLAGRGLTILHLHSSVASNEQAKIFRPGPKIILSTNLAETSVTIPDVKVVIDTGRERQFSMLDANSDTTTVVGSQLVTVNISQASAKQRAGRAGRVAPGTCYRLYTEDQHTALEAYTKPEMLRMDLSQMVIRTLSLFQAGHPLSLLQLAPDPPSEEQLFRTVQGLKGQGLVCGEDSDDVALTPLGKAVSNLPASPRLGRMLFMGLSLRVLEPALTMAALLSVPRVFTLRSSSNDSDELADKNCSDLILQMEEYDAFVNSSREERNRNRKRFTFHQVKRVRDQLAQAMKDFLRDDHDCEEWNANAHRVGAQAALVVGATPHIAHLVTGSNFFATRDSTGDAVIHPSSTNWDQNNRVHWYVYHELRTSKQPYLHVTTAVSPLEIAMFSDPQANNEVLEALLQDQKVRTEKLEWLFIVDEWVPVDVRQAGQRYTFWKLKHLLNHEVLQQIALNPKRVLEDDDCKKVILLVLSALEQQRLPR